MVSKILQYRQTSCYFIKKNILVNADWIIKLHNFVSYVLKRWLSMPNKQFPMWDKPLDKDLVIKGFSDHITMVCKYLQCISVAKSTCLLWVYLSVKISRAIIAYWFHVGLISVRFQVRVRISPDSNSYGCERGVIDKS